MIDEIIRGESKKVEFKETPPKNTEKYTKTVVAFANTQGGKLIFGVSDKTREITGIDEAELFRMMDSIANAISDACEPQIIPEIEPCTVDGKTIIVVTVSPESQRPYYLKSKGKEKGTYIRVGATTRLASPEKIKELEMEGAKISWDELICIGYNVTETAIKKLCRDMNIRRKEMKESKDRAEKLPIVTRSNLENWKVLKKTDNQYLASNAFVLLTSDYFPFSKTQCAVFKGTDRSIFLDKKEYTGPIYTQIEEAVNFVLRNIKLGVQIDGLFRKESYELPVDAIREMIVNAHCHRNFTDESCVQVAIYDDRLEVTSPGGLYNGLTFEEALQGHSKLRNRVIANIFSQIGLIEAWGTGLQRIQNAAKAYGLIKPEFIEMPESFRVNLFRKSSLPRESGEISMEQHQMLEDVGNVGENVDESLAKFGEEGEEKGIVVKTSTKNNSSSDTNTNTKTDTNTNTKTSTNSEKIMIELLRKKPESTLEDMMKATGLSKSGVRYVINKLRESGTVIREGTRKNGKWLIR